MTRVAVFIDYQNTYMGARGCFPHLCASNIDGQVYPRRLALRLVDLGREVDPARKLHSVTAFRGLPSAKYSPKGQAACQRQVDYWNAQALVRGVVRPLKYHPTEWDTAGKPSKWTAQEKGIDVLIALAMVTGAMRDEFDVAVLMSADTDLVPAIEQVIDSGKRCEVAAWKSKHGGNGRLRPPGRTTWCHWLNETEYGRVADPTDYTIPHPGGPRAAAG